MDPGVGSVSPHLDDLALSCGTYLAAHPASVMVIVFAGGPASIDPLPGWDRSCRVFEPCDDVVGTRREEDRRAAKVLQASARHLDHWDFQYRDSAYGYGGPKADLAGVIATDLIALVDELNLERWLVPLGILHPDHEVAAESCLIAVSRRSDIDWLVYEELPYASIYPKERHAAVDSLRRRGLSLAPLATPPASDSEASKRAVVECYASQLPALADATQEAISTPERIHRLVSRR
jgi:LmbE family N-acetylglucosaminyl deacetylase